MKLRYFREMRKLNFKSTTGEDITVNTADLTLVERLFLSAYLTSLRRRTKTNLAEIIFDNGDEGSICTKGHYEEYDKHISEVLKNHVELMHWIKENYKADEDKKKLVEKFSLYAVYIDTKDIHVTRNGKPGFTSFEAIAWKAFCLAAAASKQTRNDALRRVCLFNWNMEKNPADATEEEIKKYKKNKTQTKNIIMNWCNKVGIEGCFENDYFIVDRKVEVAPQQELILTDETLNKIDEASLKKMEEEIETVEDKVEEAEEAEADEDKEELLNDEEETKPLDDKFKYDDSDNFELYDGQDWLQYYWARMEEKDNPSTAPRRRELIKAMMKTIFDYFDVNKQIDKIVKSLGIKKVLIDKALDDDYFDDREDGGLAKKREIIDALREIKEDVLANWKEEEWQDYKGIKLYPQCGRLLMGYMAKAHPRIMNL